MNVADHIDACISSGFELCDACEYLSLQYTRTHTHTYIFLRQRATSNYVEYCELSLHIFKERGEEI